MSAKKNDYVESGATQGGLEESPHIRLAVERPKWVDENGEVTATTTELLDEIHRLEDALQAERDTVEGLQRTVKSWIAKHSNLKRDKEADAKRKGLWPQCVVVFRYWQERTGHTGAKFTADRFFLIERFVSMYGVEECRRAIDGVVSSDYHMKRGRYANRSGERHDGLKLIFRDDDHFDKYRAMAPARGTIRGQSLLTVARDVAERVLERAAIIESTDPADLPSIGHLLIEIQRIIRDWRFVPETPEETNGEPAAD